MTTRRLRMRRIGCQISRVGTLLSAAMLLITVTGLSFSGVPQASAAAVAGQADIVTPADGNNPNQPLTSGASATSFSLRLPVGAACTKDSQDGGYRVQSYMVQVSVDPASLTFDALGPIPTGLGASFKQPLFDASGTSYVNAQTAAATVAGGPGPVVNIPAFRLGPPDVFVPGDIPAGTYNIGIACTLGTASATQLDKYWNTQIAVVTAAADVPAGVTWTAIPNPAVTTTTSTSSTTSSSTTSTTPGGSTTTTIGDGSTTTSADGSTTSTTLELVPAGGAPTGGSSVAGSVTGLPVTGKSTTALVVWSVLLLIFGRMAVLLGRPPRVRPALA